MNEVDSRKEEEARCTKDERMTKCFARLFCAALHHTRLHQLASGGHHPAPLASQHRQTAWGRNYSPPARRAVVAIAVYCIICYCCLSCTFVVMSDFFFSQLGIVF